MYRKLLLLAAIGQLLWMPSQLVAGGPPFLCIPLDGGTQATVKAAIALIDAKLQGKRWSHPEWADGVAIHQRDNQKYLTFYMKEDVRLSDIEAALKGTDFSIPRDRLKLFGHVNLEIDARSAATKELLAALDKMDHVAIADSKEEKGLLLVTVEMPYPAVENRPKPDAVGWEKFAKNDYTTTDSSKTESPIGALELPSYNAFCDVLAEHNSNLADVHWSTTYACRALGCVSAPKTEASVASVTDLSSPRKN